jgi:hypothetical protein
MERPEPPVDRCVSLFSSVLHLYTIWLLELVGSETRLKTSTLIRDSLTAWYGGSSAVPLDLSTHLSDDRQRALQGLQDCLAKKPEVQEQLTTALEFALEALREFPLTPAQRTLLQNCAATLQRCDLNNPEFPLPL